MQHRRSSKLLAVTMASVLVLAACGDDETTESTTAPTEAATETTAAATETTAAATETTAGGGEATGALAGICPETIVLQTDWMPEAEHGYLYNLIGDGYEMDADKAYVTGPLVAGGVDQGVKIQIRSGGLPQQFTPVTQLLYNDSDILAGFVYTDEAIQFSGSEFPTVAVMSGFEKNPQMIMWDPATYPDVKGIADLGTNNVTVRYFGGAAYMDFLTATGVLSPDQVDGSYTGDPALFIADEGKAAQQGFGSAEPYLYENELTDWGKPVAYEYINDIGWKNYAQSIATKPENIEKYADCFTALVPMIQQSTVDYLTDPTHGTKVIIDATSSFGEAFGWTYTEGAAQFGVDTIIKDGLQANDPASGVLGQFDETRVADLIEKAIPVYVAQGATPKDGLTPADIVTNQFIDPSIKLP
ncbi:MAG: ABC transporter substrate-binding protein [Actinobacteria bacterium]|nr:ABC transporter substrate-binding protein [Actinomycetota bacterium]